MNRFDRKIRKLIKKIEVPESYDEKVDKVLLEIMKKGEPVPQKEKSRRLLPRLAVCLLCILCVLSLYTINAEANFFTLFKETIMDFLGRGNSAEDMTGMGVGSEKLSVGSRPDLMMELQETVIDSHSIYVLVKITAPPDIRFDENTLFDYFCFCRGSNYSANQLLGGSRSCELLEVNAEHPNMATYVVGLVYDEVLEEGSEVTVCFENLTRNPYSSTPELLMEGVWSLSFYYHPTVTDHIELEGTPDMTFPFLNTAAKLIRLELSPFGILVYADVSGFPRDELGLADTDIAIRLKMIDGTELTVVSREPGKQGYVQGGSISFTDEGEKTYEQMNLEFTNMVNIAKVAGIYIEDLYIPVK